MKKVGIITLNGYVNYGNRLQNYALQTFITKMNEYYIAETIEFTNQENKKTNIKKWLKRMLAPAAERKRYNRIKDFSQKNITTKKYHNLKQLEKDYDYFIVGSDQVWNYNFPSVNRELTLLKFSPREKNISYAASFGISKLENNKKEEYKKYLNRFKDLSVREEAGANLIKNLGIKKVEVLVDPTLLLTKEEWLKVMKKPSQVPSKYILTYFLGNLDEQKTVELKEFAKKQNATIINLLDKKSKYYQSSPEEFLYLEKNAMLICTDSFHSAVFATIFNVPFIVYKRNDQNKNMYSRIEQLLKLLKLEDREFKRKLSEKSLTCDFTNSNKIIQKEQKKSQKYLMNALMEKIL